MKFQIAKIVFLMNLSIMKHILDLGTFKLGKNSDDYVYFKKQVMSYFYDTIKKLFKTLSDEKIVVRCECKANLIHGYSDCSCGGSGYKNKENK